MRLSIIRGLAMKTILLLGIAAALATSLRGEAPTTLPSTRPAAFNPLLDAQRRQVALQRDMYERMPIAATYPMDQVVRLTPINGFLRADFGAAVAVAGQGRFKVEGCDATDMYCMGQHAASRSRD